MTRNDLKAITALIKEHLSVSVCVTCGGEDVDVTLLWDNEPFACASDSCGSGDQGGPQL